MRAGRRGSWTHIWKPSTFDYIWLLFALHVMGGPLLTFTENRLPPKSQECCLNIPQLTPYRPVALIWKNKARNASHYNLPVNDGWTGRGGGWGRWQERTSHFQKHRSHYLFHKSNEWPHSLHCPHVLIRISPQIDAIESSIREPSNKPTDMQEKDLILHWPYLLLWYHSMPNP